MKLSIITINYNNDAGLQRTLDSVANQTYTDFEHIIIDGASTDNSVEKIRAYSQSPLVSHYKIIWLSEKDKGVYNAMNKGIDRAIGEYLLFLNSGDYLVSSDTLSNLNLDNQYSDLIIGYSVEEETNRKIDYPLDRLSLFHLMQQGISHQAMFIKRDLFIKIGLYAEDLRVLSDYEFLLKCTFEDLSFINTKQHIAIVEPGGVSNSMLDLIQKEKNEVLNRVLPKTIDNDYRYILSKKQEYNIAKKWLDKTKWLFNIVNFFHKVYKRLK